MVRHTLKILQHLQQLLQDFLSVSDHFTTLRGKGLKRFRRKKLTFQHFILSLIFRVGTDILESIFEGGRV